MDIHAFMDIILQLSVLFWISIWISLDFYGCLCNDLLWIFYPGLAFVCHLCISPSRTAEAPSPVRSYFLPLLPRMHCLNTLFKYLHQTQPRGKRNIPRLKYLLKHYSKTHKKKKKNRLLQLVFHFFFHFYWTNFCKSQNINVDLSFRLKVFWSLLEASTHFKKNNEHFLFSNIFSQKCSKIDHVI